MQLYLWVVKAEKNKKQAPAPAKADSSTEEKIREAARKVFTRKGYAATRTRDIAEEAGINLALLNYYFRSKEKLFQLIMIEKLQHFFSVVGPVIYDAGISLEVKIDRIVTGYIYMLLVNPDLPYFILGEVRSNPGIIASAMPNKDFLKNSLFVREIREKRPDLDPYQFFLSLLGMTIFPFIMRPVFQKITFTDDARMKQMLIERKKLIPLWSRAMLKAK